MVNGNIQISIAEGTADDLSLFFSGFVIIKSLSQAKTILCKLKLEIKNLHSVFQAERSNDL